MGKVSSETGVTYWRLNPSIHGYQGDKFKNNCGLTGAELDSNFHFLRGVDIKDGTWDANKKQLIFNKVNGERIVVEGVDPGFIINTSGSTFDRKNGVLTLVLNGNKTEISGFPTDIDLSGYVTKEIFEEHECDNTKNFNATAEAIDEINENIKEVRDKILKEIEKELDEIGSALYENMPTEDIDRHKKGIIQRILDLETKDIGKVDDVFVDGLSVLDKDKVAQIYLKKKNPQTGKSFYEEIKEEWVWAVNEEIKARKAKDKELEEAISQVVAKIEPKDKDISVSLDSKTKITYIGIGGISNPEIEL